MEIENDKPLTSGYWASKPRDEIWEQVLYQMKTLNKNSFNIYSFYTLEFRTHTNQDYIEFEKVFESIVKEHNYHIVAVYERVPISYIIAPDQIENRLDYHHLQ